VQVDRSKPLQVVDAPLKQQAQLPLTFKPTLRLF
jgi:hypothetical protein